MKKTKHLLPYYIVSLFFLALYPSCENKRDDSGTLGGMWQLVEWKATDGSIAYNKPDTTLYYKVRNNILMLQELPGESDTYFLTYYRQSEGNIIINPDKIFNNAELDKIAHPVDDLKKYGIPNSGCLHIDVLESDKMVLSSEEGTLRFRKY
ncbi:MAG: lipocalin-like domain-containing protein [Bacteroidaceae bacterium]|jgi:hypothetical protein|nr:lipocalin-like domain-containing protein [Bacteroidaceae bacterium]